MCLKIRTFQESEEAQKTRFPHEKTQVFDNFGVRNLKKPPISASQVLIAFPENLRDGLIEGLLPRIVTPKHPTEG
jgi:hypothetical protein